MGFAEVFIKITLWIEISQVHPAGDPSDSSLPTSLVSKGLKTPLNNKQQDTSKHQQMLTKMCCLDPSCGMNENDWTQFDTSLIQVESAQRNGTNTTHTASEISDIQGSQVVGSHLSPCSLNRWKKIGGEKLQLNPVPLKLEGTQGEIDPSFTKI